MVLPLFFIIPLTAYLVGRIIADLARLVARGIRLLLAGRRRQ